MVHKNICATNAQRSQLARSLGPMTEATGQCKLDIRLQLEQLPRITRWLMDTGSQRLAKLRKCDLGKVKIGQLAWWRWQGTEQVWLAHRS